MYMTEALILLVVVLLVLRPLVQQQRERALADRLKQVHNPAEALATVDSEMNLNRLERGFIERLRESYFFWLR